MCSFSSSQPSRLPLPPTPPVICWGTTHPLNYFSVGCHPLSRTSSGWWICPSIFRLVASPRSPTSLSEWVDKYCKNLSLWRIKCHRDSVVKLDYYHNTFIDKKIISKYVSNICGFYFGLFSLTPFIHKLPFNWRQNCYCSISFSLSMNSSKILIRIWHRLIEALPELLFLRYLSVSQPIYPQLRDASHVGSNSKNTSNPNFWSSAHHMLSSSSQHPQQAHLVALSWWSILFFPITIMFLLPALGN